MHTQKNNDRVAIIVPVYNEDPSVVDAVIETLQKLPFIIVIVDDGSAIPVSVRPDEKTHIIRHFINLGQGAALQTGFEFSKIINADYIVTFDADGQHQVSDIEKLLLPLQSNEADVCLGSRFIGPQNNTISKGRTITIKTARLFNFIFTGKILSDAHNGLRAFNRTALETISLTENRMAHATEIILKINKNRLRYKEIPVSVLYTNYSLKKGQSALNGLRIILDLFLNKLFE